MLLNKISIRYGQKRLFLGTSERGFLVGVWGFDLEGSGKGQGGLDLNLCFPRSRSHLDEIKPCTQRRN